jgi:hypothetical protein
MESLNGKAFKSRFNVFQASCLKNTRTRNGAGKHVEVRLIFHREIQDSHEWSSRMSHEPLQGRIPVEGEDIVVL